MDHTLHERLGVTEFTDDNLVDAVIYGPADEKIGSVAHMHGTGPTAQVIVDVGGFLGIGAKPVALQVSQLDFRRDEDGSVHATTSLTKDQVKALPEHHEYKDQRLGGAGTAQGGWPFLPAIVVRGPAWEPIRAPARSQRAGARAVRRSGRVAGYVVRFLPSMLNPGVLLLIRDDPCRRIALRKRAPPADP